MEKSLTLVIDGVFFQINQTGIARVWSMLLKYWQKSGFITQIILIDRAETAPKLEGINYYSMSAYDYRERALDSERLQFVCDKFQADLFISTYYTTPLTTPSILMIHDMIPEVFGFDLSELCWQEKYYSILYATRYITVSQNTNRDLLKFYPHINKSLVSLVYNGVDKLFEPASHQEILQVKEKIGIGLPYFLIVGSRMSLQGYKNAIVFFKALSQWQQKREFEIVCVGGETELEIDLFALTKDLKIHLLQVNDLELKAIYSGAIALVYPSLYEGFGLPIVEAMACGCPVITCRNSSLSEVAGDAAIYVDEYDVLEMIQSLEKVQVAEVRQKLIQAGLKQAKKFSWDKMAEDIANICLKTVQEVKSKQLEISQFSLLWQDFRQEQIKLENSRKVQADQQSSHLEEITKLQRYLELATAEIEAMKTSKFWKIRSLWFAIKKQLGFSS